jgi:TetR/AcrR family transcriptional repressor of nem operon
MEKPMPTPERIVEAATSLFWRNGYHAVSVDQICKGAGILKGSFYHVFPSKAELLLVVLRRVWEADRAEIAEIYAGRGEVRARFRDHLQWIGSSQHALFHKYGFVPGTFDMVMDINIPPDVVAFVRDARAQHLNFLGAAVGEILPASKSALVPWLAGAIMHFISGALIDARLRNSLAPLDGLPESISRFVAFVEGAPGK